MDPAYIAAIENGEEDRDEAVRYCIHLFRQSWAQIRYIAEVFKALGEDDTAAQLYEAADQIEDVINGHYEIDMDGGISVRPPSTA